MGQNKLQLGKDTKASKAKKTIAQPKDIHHKSMMGYRDDSPYRNEPYIDIYTLNGIIDMSNTGIPLWANGELLQPYSGQHQFDSNVVREVPYKQDGGEMHQMPDGSWMYNEDHPGYEDGGEVVELTDEEIEEYRRQGYVVEEYQDGGNIDFEQYGWQYKKEGENYLTRQKGKGDWITAKGNALKAIKTEVYGENVGDYDSYKEIEEGTVAPNAEGYTRIPSIDGLGSKRIYKAPELTYEKIDPSTIEDPDYERALRSYDNLFIDRTNNKSKDIENKIGSIHNATRRIIGQDEKGNNIYSSPACAAGAFDCEAQTVVPILGTKSIRGSLEEIGNISNTPYSLPSKGKGPGQYKKNESYDSWELAEALLAEQKGYESYNAKTSEKLDYSSIPVGSIVLSGAGDDKVYGTQPYVPAGLKDKSRHTATVIAFDEKDGMPLIYDYGRLARLDDTKSTTGKMGINNIITPTQYKGYDYKSLKGQRAQRDKELGVTDFKPTESKNTDAITDVYKSTDEILPDVSRSYNLPINTLKKIQDRVTAIGIQETNLNEEGPRDDVGFWRGVNIGIGDTSLFTEAVKPLVKGVDNLSTSKGKADWQIEVEAYKKQQEGDPRGLSEIYSELRNKTSKPDSEIPTESSLGAFKIKDFPEYLTEKYGMTKDELGGLGGSREEIKKGSKAALVHVVENFSNLKKKYPNYSDSQILDLATIGYNNKSKMSSEEFHQHYILNNIEGLKDNYLEKIKSYEDQYSKKIGQTEEPAVEEGFTPAKAAKEIKKQKTIREYFENEEVKPTYNRKVLPPQKKNPYGALPFKEGGVVELTDQEIEEYIKKGYRVDFLD